jgi:hypothetical protein
MSKWRQVRKDDEKCSMQIIVRCTVLYAIIVTDNEQLHLQLISLMKVSVSPVLRRVEVVLKVSSPTRGKRGRKKETQTRVLAKERVPLSRKRRYMKPSQATE